MTSYTTGIRAEETACNYLQSKGYMLLQQRFKSPYGEVDLVMRDKGVLVAVEVKYRKSLHDGHYSISSKQQRRVSDALVWYASQHNLSQVEMRCDVVLISAKQEIILYQNAWQDIE